MFAKLFDTPLGQVVVLRQGNEYNEPEIRFFYEPEGLGVCSMAFSYETWDNQETAFDKVTQEMANDAAQELNKFNL